MHEISVIISNFNGGKWIPRLMETLREQRGVSLEIIVVDRNSTDGSGELLARYPEVKVVSHPPETGLVCGYAFGYRSATKDLLFFMNEDMWLEPECLKRTADAIDLNGRVGATMPVQMTYDLSGLVNTGCWYVPALWYPACPYPFRGARFRIPEKTIRSSQINAGACLVHRSVYEQAGGWDTTFFLDYEDTDFSLRLWQLGWWSVVVPSAVIGHAVGASNAQTIAKTKTKVSKKRYIEGGANVIAICIKTFSAHLMWLPLLGVAERCLRNLLRGRFEQAGWDVAQVNFIFRRLPELLEYRHAHRRQNECCPGEEFFKAPEFDFRNLEPVAS